LEERIEGMEKEYESLEKKHLEVETTVYAEERLEELRQENSNLDEALAEERQMLEDLQQEYEKVVDELEELKESRDIDMLDAE
jgi:predicted transcriptional regulator